MTASQLRCLIELRRLSETRTVVSSVYLTAALKVSKPSVHRLLEGLRSMGFVEKEYYGQAQLTEEGNALADRMLILLKHLSERLGDSIIKPENAYDAAIQLLSAFDERYFSCFADTDIPDRHTALTR